MKKLWLLLVNGLISLMLVPLVLTTRATPVDARHRHNVWWQHVNKTCLVAQGHESCDPNVSMQHMREMQRNMNPHADPCEDFHAYACGNWQGELRAQPQMSSMMKLADSQLTDKYVQLFDGLLPKRKRFASECHILCAQEHVQVYESLVKYYNVCRHSEPVTLRGYFDVLAGETVWRAQPYSWLAGLAQVVRYGQADLFLQLEVKQENATYHAVRVQPVVSGCAVRLTTAIYDRISAYTRHNYHTLRRQFERLERALRDIMTVACVGAPLDAEGECDLREEFTFGDLQQAVGEIDWRHLLGALVGEPLLEAPHLRIRIEDVASVRKIARHLSREEPELLRAYTLARFANYLQQLPHSPLHAGVSAQACMRHVRKLFHQPMTFLYEQAAFAAERDQAEPLIRHVFEQLKREFRQTLQHNRLQLDGAAVMYLQRKLQSLRLNIGNMPPNATARFYVDYMRGVSVGDSFYVNHLHALLHAYSRQRALAALRPGADDNSDWHTLSYHAPHFMDNIDATAYYFCLNNMIVLPHAYLQLPLFHRHFWPALVYGDLANTLGHELMHAFDSNFVLYDQRGHFHEELAPLFSSERTEAAVRCLGANTTHLTERIADISGTRLTIDTFLRDAAFMRHNGRVFFLQFAQFFCGSADEATHAAEDPIHDLDRLRLNYALAQTPEFASTFNCPRGSALNPPHRCEYW